MTGHRGRGRGRGGARGRGRGNGHARGRGRMFRQVHQRPEATQEKQDKNASLDISEDVRAFFVGQASFDQHYDAQESNRAKYIAGFVVLEKHGVEISQNARVRALAAAWARKDHMLAEAFLADRTKLGMVEVLKAVNLLDSSRQIRFYEKKIKRLQMHSTKLKPDVIGKIKSNIDNLTAVKPKAGSASGAVCRHVARWVRQFTTEELEFFALHFPTDPWRKLADICHFNPEKDFPNLPWFLSFCYGNPPPEGSMVRQCRTVTAENVNNLLKEYPIPYSHLKELKTSLTADSKARIATSDKLDTVLWYYEDLQCAEVDAIVQHRLEAGESVTLGNGKLMERLLTLKMIREDIPIGRSSYFRRRNEQRIGTPTKAGFIKELLPLAQDRLNNMSLPLEAPIVVIGDRSGSMEVAIRTSTIIASLLTSIVQAKLVFFNTANMDAKFIPTNIEEVLEMAVTVEASGGTAPAASLWPFYDNKEVVKTFIVVTDEEENQTFKNFGFADLYKKYHDEVYPARLIFVSFLRHQHSKDQMVSALENSGFHPLQFKFENARPDLTKLENLFGLLSSESGSFEEEVKKVMSELRDKGIQDIFQKLHPKDVDMQEANS